MAQMTMIQAITDALRTELKNDENVLVFGEDVGVNGGVFRATEGLQKEFGEDRVCTRLRLTRLPSCNGNSIFRLCV